MTSGTSTPYFLQATEGTSTPSSFLSLEKASPTSSLIDVEQSIQQLSTDSAEPIVETLSTRRPKKSLRPYVHAIMAFGSQGRKFQRRQSIYRQRRLSEVVSKHEWVGPPLDTIFAGISSVATDSSNAVIALAIRDTTYLLDFSVRQFQPEEIKNNKVIADFVIAELKKYEEEHLEKFLGIGLPKELAATCPDLCSRLWSELDIVPLILRVKRDSEDVPEGEVPHYWDSKSVDEQADSMARKCIRYFGPSQTPLLQVGFRGHVQVDAGYHAYLATLKDFEKTVGATTWNATMKYVKDLKERNVKIAFFSATPQGGGVALMRHALVRFARILGLNMKWYVPKPKPGVFRITKNNHNILQGVAKADEFLAADQKTLLTNWITENAERYWFCSGGPLTRPEEGGADVIIIDDPQMPGLIPMIKALTPDRPVIYRSHIQVRSDLVATAGSPQADAWNYLWENIKLADLFISHPVQAFVPHTVPPKTVGYLPATTDWLDGLNKDMNEFDTSYFGRVFNSTCLQSGMPTLEYPATEYIIQVARFDPAKGIPDVLRSYATFHERLMKEAPNVAAPQLLICGHGSIDDPDGAIVYDQTLDYIEQYLPPYISRKIVVMRVGPSDQVLNALMSKAKIALQLSTREGFEIKVSEALHKGKPIIATLAGGIPIQVQHGKNGFLVETGDTDAVAQHLYDLWTDADLYERMSKYAAVSVSDEVSTVGNALSWLYLASTLSKGTVLKPDGKWINDMAREEAAEPYKPGENKLKRAVTPPN
ncbi:MAG: hypothetical protein M1834_007637 [Cirrosporium novae-zelandiae]|nr:MAG: hypothetical protein M1834_007637 [Cirrosporium novae-zelandiae]